LDDIADPLVTVVLEGMPQTFNSSVDRYRFMHAPSLETSLAALEQADLIIGI
jgi:hypothetical protein